MRPNEHLFLFNKRKNEEKHDIELQKVDQLLMQLPEMEIQSMKQRLSSKAFAQIIDVSDFDADGLKEVFNRT